MFPKCFFWCLTYRYETSIQVKEESFQGKQSFKIGIQFIKKINFRKMTITKKSKDWRFIKNLQQSWLIQLCGKKRIFSKQKNPNLIRKKTSLEKNRKSAKVSGNIKPACEKTDEFYDGIQICGDTAYMFCTNGYWICNTKSAWHSQILGKNCTTEVVIFLSEKLRTETKTSWE